VEHVLAGRTLRHGRIEPIEIGLDAEGFIARLGRDLRGSDRHDLGDRLLLPAATDLHVHFRHPTEGRSGETWGSGTVQAALGGVGLVGEMPNGEPPVDSVERLVGRRAAGEGRIAVDMLLYAALTRADRVTGLAFECGGFKLYMAPTSGVDAPPGPEELAALLAAVAATGSVLTVHAEDPGRFRAPESATNAREWDLARPPDAEMSAVDRLLALAPPELRLNVAHVSTAEAARKLAAAGTAFEVTPHHLLLSVGADGGARSKVNPPLRAAPVRAALFRAFGAGEVPFVASDHAPHPAAAKDRPFPLAPSGVPGVGTMLPVLLANVRSGVLPLEVLVRAACERPARWFGVPMGRLEPGYRADILVIDPRERRKVRSGAPESPGEGTPFEGREAIFPLEHYHDGERIVTGGEYVGSPRGRFVRPEFAPLRRGTVGDPRTSAT
jgi:dihydroorotase